MKIVRHTIVVDAAPYSHLGYIAAWVYSTSYKPDYGLLGAGGLFLTGAAAVLMRAMWRWERQRQTAATPRRFPYRGLCVPAVLAILGTLAIRHGLTHGHRTYTHAEELTENNARAILVKLAAHQGPMATAMDDIRTWQADDRVDGWSQDMRIEDRSSASNRPFAVTSADPDREFGTADDRRYLSEDVPNMTDWSHGPPRVQASLLETTPPATTQTTIGASQ